MNIQDRAVGLAYKKRNPPRVRTPEGVAKYGQSIGQIIRRDLVERVLALAAAAKPKGKQPKAARPKATRKPPSPESGWFTDWEKRGLFDEQRVSEEGVVLSTTSNPDGTWTWTAKSTMLRDAQFGRDGKFEYFPAMGPDDFVHYTGAAKTREGARAAAEDATRIIVERRGKAFPAETLGEFGLDTKENPRTYSRTEGGFTYGVTFFPGLGSFRPYVVVPGSTTKRWLAHQDGTVFLWQSGDMLEQVRNAVSSSPDWIGLLKRRKNHETWQEYSDGIRGVDWHYPTDPKPTTARKREFLADTDSGELGIGIGDNVPVEYKEIINMMVWTYEAMYPGFTKLFRRQGAFELSYGYSLGIDDSTLAYTINTANTTRYKRIQSYITLVKTAWSNDRRGEGLNAVPDSNGYRPHVLRPEMYPEGYEEWQFRLIAVLHHEFGHIVYETLASRPDLAMELIELLMKAGMLADIDPNTQTGRIARGPTALLISSYGATNLFELAAEAWAEYVQDPHPRELSAQIGEIMGDALISYLEKRN